MRTLIKTFIIACMTLPTFALADDAPKKNSIMANECLKVKGLALDERSFAIDGVEVRLFKQNDMMEQIDVTNVEHHDHNFTFTLEANEYYTVKVSKPGYVERWVVFRTELPIGINVESLLNFDFEVVLFKEKQMDDYYLDFPIAFINYNEQTQVFENNTKYTKYIKDKIKEAEEFAKTKNVVQKKSIATK
jgi:hypothetical protein